jgi:hypothetical protein
MPVDAIGEPERGRAAYANGAWSEAFESRSSADRAARLDAGDLELLARAAYMLGRDDDYAGGLERAHHAHLEAQAVAPAARCAFWIGHNLLFRGERGRASGWFSRGRRLLEAVEQDCVERGYPLIPVWLEQMGGATTRPPMPPRPRPPSSESGSAIATSCGSRGTTRVAR